MCSIDKEELEFRHLTSEQRKTLNTLINDYNKKHEQDLNIRLLSKREHERT